MPPTWCRRPPRALPSRVTPRSSLLSLSTSDYSGLGETVAGIQDELDGQRTNLVLPSLRVDSVDEGLYEPHQPASGPAASPSRRRRAASACAT